MRKDERLKTIYETIAPHIIRSESAWRDYLEFSSKFYKYSFDNALLVFAQNPNVTMLAPTVVWNKVGRYVNKGSTGIAVCEYENARLTIKHLFDISQTHGKDVIATNWQFDEDMRKHIVSSLSEGYNLNITDFAEWIRQVCSKDVMDNSNNYMKVFKDDFENNIFAELPKDGLEMQLQELIKDSTTYFVGKRCGLTDEEIKLEHGMATVAHFNTVPLIAKLGHMVTDISRGILGEIERSVKTIEKERSVENEQNRNDLHREGWNENSRYPDIQQQGGRQATREVRQDGHGIPERTKPTAIYDFENGWHTDGDYAQSTRGSSGEDRESNTTDVKDRPDAKYRGHYGEDQAPEQPEIISRGNGDKSGSLPSEINKEPNIQNKEQSQSKESLVDGSFFVPKEGNNLDESDKDGELLKVLIVEQGKTPYVAEIKNGYREFQQQIGGRFTTIEIENGIDAICNDDVYFEDTPINRIISGQAIFGTFLIARVGDDGEYISLSDIDIKRYYRQFEIPLVDIIDLVNQYEDIPEIEPDQSDTEIRPVPNKNSRANELGTQETLFDIVTNHDERRIETILLEGSGVQGGKKRIYDFAMTNPTGSAFAGFLKNEYGIGGHSLNKDGIRFENHDSKGIEFEWIDENGNKNKTKVSWIQAAIVIQKLIDQERYLDSQELEIEDALDNTEDDYQYEKYFMLKTELEDLKKELNEIETKWESEDGSSYTELKFWQDLQSLKHDLEKELEEMEYRKDSNEKSTNEEESNHQKEVTVSSLVDEEELVEPKNVKTNFRYSETYDLYPNGAKTKYRNNIEAIKLLKCIEEENRFASLDEQIILARYVGWGGLANAFSDTASGWENEYHELKVLLDEKEYEDARNSTITAYYTEPELIKCMYNAFEQFGFSGGSDRKILDPAMGTGNFFSVIPEELACTSLYGVEIDSITGRIAKQLYQNANIFVQGYETTNFKDNSFDIVLGNIPFNNIKLYDKRYEDEDFLIHDYFIAKSLDLVKPGGIIGFITSKGTMDKKDTSVREYIAQRADLIGAIRLPNTAFKALAGTEVTADILFFQKLSEPRSILPNWISTNVRKADYMNMNQYFIDHPEMILGEMKYSRNMYGNEENTACIAPEGQDLYEELNKAIQNLNATFTAQVDKTIEMAENESEEETIKRDARKGTKNYTYVVQEDKIYYCEHNKLIPQEYSGKRAERIKGLCEIREELLNVINVQTREYTPNELIKAQEKLNSVYDRFVDSCGYINEKANIAVFSDDDQFPLLRSIEDQSEDKQSWIKAPIFYKATIKSYHLPEHVETAKEALEISLNVKMKIDLTYMTALTDKTADQLIKELGDRIFLNPQKYYGNYYEGWELNEEYLSGQVRDKLIYAKMKAEEYPDLFTRNVEALEAVQPARLLPGDIDFRIGSPWIPMEYYRQFMHETFGTPYYLKDAIDINYMEYTTQWRVLNKTRDSTSVKVNQTYGTSRVNAYQIFEDCLNLQSTTVRDPVPYIDANGKEQVKYVINANQTMIARAKQNQIKEAFGAWLFNDKERAEVLLNIYNEKFNTIRPRVYEGSHLVFPSMSEEVKLRPHQKNFAARVIYSGTGLAGHVVGAGKTAALIASGMYLKSIGAIKKPIYVVPNHLTEQWAKEFYRFFPQANILVTTKKDFSKDNRNKFVSRIAMGEYDAIIIGHSQFERIPISKERQEKQLNEEINQISYVIKKMREEKGDNWSIKQMVIFQNNLKNRLTKLAAEGKKDDLLTFEQLGVDFMFVDEAHVYKNCFSYTKMRNVAGIGKSSSQRATDMLLKCQYLQETNNGKGIVFATGTPISNSMSVRP